MSGLANSLGVSSPTISNAISYFERSFMVRLLQPWYANIGKRLVKSPKIYIRDSGIVNYLLGISDYETLLRHPLLGNLWEGYVVEEIIKTLGNEYQYYFYRTADGAECDLVIYKGNDCIAAIDAKFSNKPQRTKSMAITRKDLQVQNSYYIVPECPAPYTIAENQQVVSLWQFSENLEAK